MKSKQYLEEIRGSAGLVRAVLRKIEVKGKTVTFFLVTDVAYSPEDIAYARGVSAKYVPAGFNAEVKVIKSVPDEAGVRRAVADILKTRFPGVAAFVDPEDIAVAIDGAGGRFFVNVGELERDRMTGDGVLDAVSEELARRFCGTWFGEVNFVSKERGEIEYDAPPEEEYVAAPRFFPIEKYEPIDGANPRQAIYIADLTKELTNVTVCGTIAYIEERATKAGKPYFSFTVTDASGQLRCSYFSKKATVEKVRALKQGDSVCLTGDNELFNGTLSFRAKNVDYGSAPAGFVPEERPSRPVPAQYRVVFPTPVSDPVQDSLFGKAPLPDSFCKREFVVFDLETTGLNNSPAMGQMDRIIEVGAVKIRNGRIEEKFSTFVACPVRLSEKIVELTGITDDMLVGAPALEDVIADFYKFTAGCALVAHNMSFDYKFVRYYGEEEGFLFDNPQYDTLVMSQKLLRMNHHKLNNVADFFGFTFNHHRAFDDAFVTAKIFLELVRMNGDFV